MSNSEIAVRFEEVSYERGHNKPILDEVNFSVRKNMKMTLMAQNGAGKSTLIRMMTTLLPLTSGAGLTGKRDWDFKDDIRTYHRAYRAGERRHSSCARAQHRDRAASDTACGAHAHGARVF